MTKAEIKKVSQQALTKARQSVGAKRTPIKISDRQWEAIQAGAVSENVLLQMLKFVDGDELRQRATPRSSNTLSQAKINKIMAMGSSSYDYREIADAIGISTASVAKYLKGKE